MRRTQVAVVGGGPAGLAAAIAAAQAGAATVLLDEQPELGGQLRYRIAEIAVSGHPLRPAALRAALVAEADAAGVDLRPGSIAWGRFEDNVLGVAADRASYLLAADAVVLATGSTDLPFPFAGGSLPGVFSARAVQLLLHRHRVRPGRRAALLGGGPEATELAADLRLAGVEVTVAVDPIATGAEVVAEGRDGVHALRIDGTPVAVDTVVVAVGRQPDAALALIAGCAAAHAAALGGHVPVLDDRLRTSDPRLLVAGDAAGVCDAATALAEGCYAGASAAASLGLLAAPAVAAARVAYEAAAPARLAIRRRLAPTFVQAYT